MATFDKVKAQAAKAAKRGPSPADRIQAGMRTVGPARFIGTVSSSQGPVAPGDHKGPKPFFILQKPTSTEKGQLSKEA